MTPGELIFFCGKMGAGKSTRSQQIADERGAVLLSEDEWLESLYPRKISSLDDYRHYSELLKPPMKDLVLAILATGTDVVMDYPANTLAQREWFRGIYSEAGASHTLVYLEVPDHICLERVANRRVSNPERAATDTAEVFKAVTAYFVEPAPEEGFNIRTISESG